MNRVVFLFLAVVAAAAVAVVVKWDTWTGDEKPARKAAIDEDIPDLPDVHVKRVPISAVPGTAEDGPRANVTRAVADALRVLAVEGALPDLTKIANVSRSQKVPLDILTALPGANPFTVAEVEALAEEGKIDKELTKTMARDKGVPVGALEAMSEAGMIPSKFVNPFEVLGAVGDRLPIDEMAVVDGELMMTTDVLLVGEGSDAKVVKAIEVRDGEEKIRIVRNDKTGRWVLPERFETPVTADRMKLVCSTLDGLGMASTRGSSAARHDLYQVEGDDGKRFYLEDDQGNAVVELRVGKQDTSGGRNYRNAGTFVRPVGKDVVYRHAGRLATIMHTMPKVWMDLRFIPMEYQELNDMLQEVEKITLEFDDVQLGPTAGAQPREYTGERVRLVLECRDVPVEKAPDPQGPVPGGDAPKGDTERRWFVLEPESAQDLETFLPNVDGIARMLLNGRKDDILGADPENPEYGFEKSILTLDVALKGGKTYELKVGNRVPVEGELPEHQAHSRYVTLSGSPYVMSLSEFTIRGLQKRLEDLEDPQKRAAAQAASQAPGPTGPQRPVILPPDEGGKKKDDDDKKKDDEKKEGGGKKEGGDK